jgi:CRP-like cAMP-binding protein
MDLENMTMFDLLRANMNLFVPLTDAEFAELTSKMRVKTLQKHEFFLMEGDVCRNAIFINSGCLRYFFTVDGEEKTGQFFFEGTWYTDFESFLSEEPSEQNIQALETTECLIISKKDLHQLYQQHHKFERFGRLIVEHGFLGLRRKNKILTNLSPEERYLDLIKSRPKVIERVPQIHIASYLGIQPESLSRIRKRLFEQRKRT